MWAQKEQQEFQELLRKKFITKEDLKDFANEMREAHAKFLSKMEKYSKEADAGLVKIREINNQKYN